MAGLKKNYLEIAQYLPMETVLKKTFTLDVPKIHERERLKESKYTELEYDQIMRSIKKANYTESAMYQPNGPISIKISLNSPNIMLK